MQHPDRRPIQILPAHIANQIAAGEVVERPASIVKELIENSLDAGATHITIVVKSGGLQSIQVTDNGHGIPAEELALAVNRHATNKIQSIDELFSLSSMGFRGEALASIASVTRFKLISRTVGTQHASCWQNTNTQITANIEPAAHPVGTTVYADELFYNTPVRRRFIKSERTEFKYIEDVVKQMALSHAAVGFTLKHNLRNCLQVVSASSENDFQQRLVRVLGKAYTRQLIKLDFESSNLRLHGWLAAPDVERSQTDLQFFYINNRVVRDKIILHAVKQVMQPLLYPGKQAICVLFLTLPSDQVDVNVHPTKHEVRFTSPRLVHDFIVQVLQASLQKVNLHDYVSTAEPLSTSMKNPHVAETRLHYAGTQTAFRGTKKWYSPVFGTYLGLQQQYALFDHEKGVVLIDMQRAYRLYVKTCLRDTEVTFKNLIMPIVVNTDPYQTVLVAKLEALLQQIGISLTTVNNSVRLIALPVCLENADLSFFLSSLIKCISDSSNVYDKLAIDQLIDIIADSVVWKADMATDEHVETCILRLNSHVPEMNVLDYRQDDCWRILTTDKLAEIFECTDVNLLEKDKS